MESKAETCYRGVFSLLQEKGMRVQVCLVNAEPAQRNALREAFGAGGRFRTALVLVSRGKDTFDPCSFQQHDQPHANQF